MDNFICLLFGGFTGEIFQKIENMGIFSKI